MDHEDNLSDASLIEDDEEEEEIALPDDLPPSSDMMDMMEGEGEPEASSFLSDETDDEFHGFEEHEVPEKIQLTFADDNEDDLTKPFPPDLNQCLGWYPGELPKYTVKFSSEPDEDVALPENQKTTSSEGEQHKVKPLKIKKTPAGGFSTPSPFLQRESREWKPSSQFFKPLSTGWVREVIYDRNEDGSLCAKAKEVVYHVTVQQGKTRTFKSQAELRPFLASWPTLTLHNFSFRNDPLNAPKGQEIIRAVDETVEIFPPAKVEVEKPAAHAPPPAKVSSTSLSPSLPSGLLKVKMFGKMKERNAYDSPGGSSEKSDSNMEIDDEDFDLETTHSNKTQSLGNSGVTITPISHLNKGKRKESSLGGSGVNIHMPSSSIELTKKVKMLPLASKKRPILRPPLSTQVTCSIHCPNATGYPQLNCSSCKSLYHPACVGLAPTSDYKGYDFYCSTCQPPAGKENKPFTIGGSSTTITSALGSSTTKKSTPSVTLTPTGNTGAKKRSNLGKAGMPLRPIESQSVVNIAGCKYLVVPHPDHDVLKAKKKTKEGGKLAVVMKPAKNEEFPTFEVEESPDGKLILLPIGPKAGNVDLVLASKKNEGSLKFSQFQCALSAGYFSMVQVFKYLGLKDRLTASRVCKLWYQVSKHPSLWTNLSMKNCRVQDWKALRDQLNRNGTVKLDMKKMAFAQGEHKTWEAFNRDLLSAAITLNGLELPKINSATIHSIVQASKDSPITKITSLNAPNMALGDEKSPLDLVHIGQLDDLQELRLKSVSGCLIIDDFSESLTEFVNLRSESLTRLALLSLKSLTEEDLMTICQLKHLQHLELGNCDQLDQQTLFATIGQLTNLKYLRLERGKFDESISRLSELPNLTELELIDFEMIPSFGSGLVSLQGLRKLLLIPSYKDEVAAINAEALDAFMSMNNLTHFFFGLKTEWLESLSALMSSKDGTTTKDSFPVMVNGSVEMYTLSKLYKQISSCMPNAQRSKILKMPKSATRKQYLSTQK